MWVLVSDLFHVSWLLIAGYCELLVGGSCLLIRLVGLLTRWLVGLSVGRFVGWLVGWRWLVAHSSVGCFEGQTEWLLLWLL